MNPADEVWHELVLCGVGGKSVAEAKRNITFPEFRSWCEFIKKNGTPNQNLHQGFAMIATMINNMMGGEAQMTDFMRQGESGPEELTDDNIAALKALAASMGSK